MSATKQTHYKLHNINNINSEKEPTDGKNNASIIWNLLNSEINQSVSKFCQHMCHSLISDRIMHNIYI